ncbi:MAG: hypothetical protein OEZ38_06820 [Gammaproteobacteria bacterium]|nr:hypothetical protein [Gammaproteobacteria bacterium]
MLKLACMVFIVFFSLPVSGDDSYVIKNDPFKKPNYLNPAGKEDVVQKATQTLHVIDLRAVLFEHGNSIVNVAGEFYKVGDIVNGYKLTSVGVGNAVFMKNGEKIIVYVNHELMEK